MRYYITSFDDQRVDLDDLSTYSHLPNDITELEDRMYKNIGYYYCYVNYFHNDIIFDEQKERVEKLIKRFTDEKNINYKNENWYKEMIFLFEDETENMC